MAGKPISKLDDDAFTRVRIFLMNGLELDSLRTKQMAIRNNLTARVALAQLMRVEQHQATAINWLIGADHSPIETTIGYEQTAIEVTASVAQLEPDAYMAQGYRYALLENFDHLLRYSALLDRLEGKDANNITQGYTELVPARPTLVHHRAPEHDLLQPHPLDAQLATKFHALTLTGGEYQTHDYYMNIGPIYADALARQLYAGIASGESQHITHYGSLPNPMETPFEQLLLCEACEVWNYAGCLEQETNPRIKAIWEQFLDYELGQFRVALKLFKDNDRRDPAEIIGTGDLPPFIRFESQRGFVREVVARQTQLRKLDTSVLRKRTRESPRWFIARQSTRRGLRRKSFRRCTPGRQERISRGRISNLRSGQQRSWSANLTRCACADPTPAGCSATPTANTPYRLVSDLI